ncbi:unnamed protein product, partial [marine sediment metagenome]
DTNHIDLYYDQSESKFVATDGTNTAISGVRTWEHLDSIKFAITNLSGDFRLSVQTPLDIVEHVLMDNTATALGTLSGITFGTNSDETGFAGGLFADIKVWDVALNPTEIYDVFANAVTGDLDDDYDVDFRDFAMLALHWLEDYCGDCGGPDLDSDGDVDLEDVALFAQHWLNGCP